MTTALPKSRKLTVYEYFALEEKAERRSEFFDGEMFMMAGASREHNFLSRNFTAEIHTRLRGSSCQVFVSDLRLKVDATGLYTYPDLAIVCGTPEYAPENRNTLTNPKVVIEILSDSTERYDRTTKFRHYRQIPTLMEYLLVAQDEALIHRYLRTESSDWLLAEIVGMDEMFIVNSVPLSIPMRDIYTGVEFPTIPENGSDTSFE